MNTSIIHIAGNVVTVNNHLVRQRCAWCGTVLIDQDLQTIQVQCTCDERPHAEDCPARMRPATWLVGALIEVDGGMSCIIPHTEGELLPDNHCARLDPSITA